MKTQLTRSGFESIKNELNELITKKRPYAVERLHKARSMGDLSENSEYSAAKEELAFVEGRIQEIEQVLKTVVVTDNPTGNGKVELGNYVTVEINGIKDQYQIVGEFEADPMNKKLSATSPIGAALIGKKTNDLVTVKIPAGEKTYKIIDIK